MTKEQLKIELKELEKKHKIESDEIIIRYIKANNPYKLGDSFTDHIGTIRINVVEYKGGDSPSCIYYGIELNKDGTDNKKMKKRYAHQSNDIKLDIPSK